MEVAQNVSAGQLAKKVGRTIQVLVDDVEPEADQAIARYWLARIARQALHACRLEFHHPITRAPLSFEAPLPPEIFRPAQDEGIEEVRWFPLHDAVRLVTHSSLIPLMARVRALLHGEPLDDLDGSGQ